MSDFVVCKCQYCNGGIEFDSEHFEKGEPRTVECPHCHLETLIFIPPKKIASSRNSTPKWIRPFLVFTAGFLSAIILSRPIQKSPIQNPVSKAIPPSNISNSTAILLQPVSKPVAKYDSNYKKVNGVIYDTRDEKKWNYPTTLLGLIGAGWMNYGVKVQKVFGDKVICEADRLSFYPETYTGVLQITDSEFVQNFVISHFPNAQSLLSGQDLPPCRCMRVDNFNQNGVSIVAFDCGTDPNF